MSNTNLQVLLDIYLSALCALAVILGADFYAISVNQNDSIEDFPLMDVGISSY